MDISVVVTCYNEEVYIETCIRSLINQSFDGKYEIIIVDDCSNDSTQLILGRYLNDDKIQVITNDSNLGIGSSANIGIRKAKGRFVVRVDADDFVSKYFLQTLFLAVHETVFDIAIVDYSVVDNYGKTIANHMSSLEHPIAAGVMILKELLIEFGLYSEIRINEEINLNKIISDSGEYTHIQIPLYRYRRHKLNTSFSSNGRNLNIC